MSRMRRPPQSKLAIVLLLMLSAGGCSFDRQWRTLAHAPTTTSTSTGDPLAGRWDGKWTSEQNGHSGRLRAIVTPVDADTYHIDYDARFLGIMRFTHGMNVTAAREGEAVKFEGREDLGGLAGGVYRYNGTADGREFISTYESKDDHGRFEMRRPKE
jgi:hypothetical protein